MKNKNKELLRDWENDYIMLWNKLIVAREEGEFVRIDKEFRDFIKSLLEVQRVEYEAKIQKLERDVDELQKFMPNPVGTPINTEHVVSGTWYKPTKLKP